ncbi:MAG: efflux RND transporter periplasmic adaptor subunit [Bacteroidetes bacterium]|nr:efflux RND transporter periplasmic adaptor subunit [Bacteroidota bacterium]
MKFLTLIFISLFITGFISCKNGKKDKGTKEKPPPGVDVMIAANEKFENTVEVNGTVLSNEMVELHPEISGRLTYLNIPDGEKVSEGTILAKINDAELQAQLEQQKAQFDIAVKTEKRLKDLLAINGVNQADYDVAISQVNTLQAGIKVLNAQIDKTVIRAPFTGELGLRMVSPGAYVTPQTLIGTLQQTDNVKIDFTVPEGYACLINKGKSITIQTNVSNENKTATIVAIEPQINILTRNLKVRARLTNGNINPGAFVKVILTEKKEGISVPTNAIIPDAASNQVVVVKNGKAVFKNVETGVRTENAVELISGVNQGDSIVVSGVLFVRPNAPVKIKKAKKVNDKK